MVNEDKLSLINDQIHNLADQLSVIDPAYKIQTETGSYAPNIPHSIERKSDNGYVKIYFEPAYSDYSHSYDLSRIFVRIKSSDWNLQHKRNWTFKTKNLAKKVVVKCDAFLRTIESHHQAVVDKKKAETAVKAAVIRRFGEDVSKDYSFSVQEHNAHFSLKFNDAHVDVTFDNADKTFSIHGSSDLTRDQLDRIVEIVKEKA